MKFIRRTVHLYIYKIYLYMSHNLSFAYSWYWECRRNPYCTMYSFFHSDLSHKVKWVFTLKVWLLSPQFAVKPFLLVENLIHASERYKKEKAKGGAVALIGYEPNFVIILCTGFLQFPTAHFNFISQCTMGCLCDRFILFIFLHSLILGLQLPWIPVFHIYSAGAHS